MRGNSTDEILYGRTRQRQQASIIVGEHTLPVLDSKHFCYRLAPGEQLSYTHEKEPWFENHLGWSGTNTWAVYEKELPSHMHPSYDYLAFDIAKNFSIIKGVPFTLKDEDLVECVFEPGFNATSNKKYANQQKEQDFFFQVKKRQDLTAFTNIYRRSSVHVDILALQSVEHLAGSGGKWFGHDELDELIYRNSKSSDILGVAKLRHILRA